MDPSAPADDGGASLAAVAQRCLYALLAITPLAVEASVPLPAHVAALWLLAAHHPVLTQACRRAAGPLGGSAAPRRQLGARACAGARCGGVGACGRRGHCERAGGRGEGGAGGHRQRDGRERTGAVCGSACCAAAADGPERARCAVPERYQDISDAARRALLAFGPA